MTTYGKKKQKHTANKTKQIPEVSHLSATNSWKSEPSTFQNMKANKKNKPLHLSHNLCVLKLPELTMLPFPKALMQELSSFQWKKPKCREVNVNKTDTSQLAKKELASSNYKTSFLGLQLVD